MKNLRPPRLPRWTLAITLPLALAACATQPDLPVGHNAPGFLSGLLHGFGIVFAFIGTFFSGEIEIYALPNSGWSYDLGYIIGAGVFFGGAGGGASGKR